MYFLTSKEEGAIERPVFAIEIDPNRDKLNLNPLSFLILRERADGDARRLSLLFPEGRVVLKTMSRVKAVYISGQRVQTNDYRSFYDNLSDEEYENTKILCDETHTYV